VFIKKQKKSYIFARQIPRINDLLKKNREFSLSLSLSFGRSYDFLFSIKRFCSDDDILKCRVENVRFVYIVNAYEDGAWDSVILDEFDRRSDSDMCNENGRPRAVVIVTVVITRNRYRVNKPPDGVAFFVVGEYLVETRRFATEIPTIFSL